MSLTKSSELGSAQSLKTVGKNFRKKGVRSKKGMHPNSAIYGMYLSEQKQSNDRRTKLLANPKFLTGQSENNCKTFTECSSSFIISGSYVCLVHCEYRWRSKLDCAGKS